MKREGASGARRGALRRGCGSRGCRPPHPPPQAPAAPATPAPHTPHRPAPLGLPSALLTARPPGSPPSRLPSLPAAGLTCQEAADLLGDGGRAVHAEGGGGQPGGRGHPAGGARAQPRPRQGGSEDPAPRPQRHGREPRGRGFPTRGGAA